MSDLSRHTGIGKELTESELQRLLWFWRTDTLISSVVPDTGTVNTIRVLCTRSGNYILRIYRHSDKKRIEREHKIIEWVCDRGVPVTKPLRTLDGGTYLKDNGRLITLLPFASGRQVAREDFQPFHVEIAGRFLGDLHNILKDCPIPGIPAVEINLDQSETFEEIDRLEKAIRAIEKPKDTDGYALNRLETRRSWLRQNQTTDVSELFSLEFQVLHGDYQESNLFFEDGAVSAIFDWDKVYTATAAWEVIRTFDLMLRFDPESCSVFLNAYRSRKSVALTELDIAARCYGLMRAYDFWLFEEIYEVGNERCRQFLRPGGFNPIISQWERLRPHLEAI